MSNIGRFPATHYLGYAKSIKLLKQALTLPHVTLISFHFAVTPHSGPCASPLHTTDVLTDRILSLIPDLTVLDVQFMKLGC